MYYRRKKIVFKSCEMEKIMSFLKETEMFEKMLKNEEQLTRSACRKQCLIGIDDFDAG